ncbi:MAG: putative transcriptional regulator [Pseudohongiellaceae bacterium]|jgi:predicted transcriptional regulator
MKKIMILGELEKLVLNYFWTVSGADAKQVHEYFVEQRGGSLNTIQTTLDRLFKKGLLNRQKIGHAFHYSAANSRKAFIGQLILSVTQDFVSSDEDNLLAAFVSVSSDLDDQQLGELEATILEYESKKSDKGSKS